MLSNLSNPIWWKDAALRAAYTALAIALPYLGAATLNAVPWLTVALAAALGYVASLATSLAGLPEVEGVNLPWWLAAVERVVKTFAQSLVAGFVGATLITDVDWAFVLQAAALAALTSLVRLILETLPADPTKRAGYQPPSQEEVDAALSSPTPRVVTDDEGRILFASPK